MTRGQMTRAERERRQIRNITTGILVGVALGALILLYGVVSTFFIRPNEAVASVNGVNITRGTYLKVRRYNVFQSIQQQIAQGNSTVNSSIQAAVKTVDNETTLDAATINQLIDGEVIHQYAKSDAALNISASDDDLKKEARKNYIPTPSAPETPASAVSPTSVVTTTTPFTPTATSTFTPGPPTHSPTATSTLPPVPGAEQTAEASYKNVITMLGKGTNAQPDDVACQLGCPNLSESDYLHLIVEPIFLQTKVTDKLSATKVLTEVEQIHAAHILTDTKDGANSIISLLEKHGSDPNSVYFKDLANLQSKEQLQRDAKQRNGGDLGWFPQKDSGFVQEFVDGAWPVPAGDFTHQPISTTFGFHVIKVLERDPHRPVPQSTIDQNKSKVFQDWLDAAKKKATIVSKAPAPAVQPTQPVIPDLTQAPIVLTPAPSGGTPAPTNPPAGTLPTTVSVSTPTTKPK